MIDRIEARAPAEAGEAAELNARHDRYLWDAVIRYYETPLPLARGRGQYLYDHDGREYLARTWFVEPNEAEARAEKAVTRRTEPWNGQEQLLGLTRLDAAEQVLE